MLKEFWLNNKKIIIILALFFIAGLLFGWIKESWDIYKAGFVGANNFWSNLRPF